jgi:hypothetical protein
MVAIEIGVERFSIAKIVRRIDELSVRSDRHPWRLTNTPRF